MKKSNKLPLLLTCILLVLAMVGGVAYTEAFVENPDDKVPCKSPCACCMMPKIIYEAEEDCAFDGLQKLIATVTVELPGDGTDAAVTSTTAKVVPVADAPIGTMKWGIYATDAGEYDIAVTADALVDGKVEDGFISADYTAVVAKRAVTVEIAEPVINYLYHENALEVDETYKALDKVVVKCDGVVSKDRIVYTLVADVVEDEFQNVKVNEEGYPWYIVVDPAANPNYDVTVVHSKEAPAKLIVTYWEGVQLDFSNAANAAGWYNAANKATIDLAQLKADGKLDVDFELGIAKEFNGTYGTVVTNYADADGAVASYYLENMTTGARTAEMKTGEYKQDCVAPVVTIKHTYEGNYRVEANDNVPAGVSGVVSDIVYGEVLAGGENSMRVFRVISDDSSFKKQDGVWAYTGVYMLVGRLQATVTDKAGNVAVSAVITDFCGDKDGDGLNNLFEGVSWDADDYDGDGLSDYMEATTGYSDRLLYDTDEDGLNDGIEYNWGLNARRADSDMDGISDPNYVRYMEAMGLTELDIELAMLLMQSNLTRANNQETVPAADLVMLKDSIFQMDNGSENPYTELINETGVFAQMQRYSKNFHMLRYDERDNVAVYLTTTSNSDTFYLVMANVQKNGMLQPVVAYQTPFTAANGLASATSADGSIVVLAPWTEGAAAENLVLFDLNNGVQFRFGGVANTVGATRFALSNDGAVLAYVGADMMLHTIDMTKENYTDVAYNGNALHFMADGQLMTNVDETTPNGVYHVAQPTINSVSLALVDDGVQTAMGLNGRFFYRDYALFCQPDGQARASEGIRIDDLYKNLIASN